jgi:hypothetical protein
VPSLKLLPVPKINRNVDALLRKCGFTAAERLAAHLLMTEADEETGLADFSLEDARKRLGLGSIRLTLEKLRKNGLAVRLERGRHRNEGSCWDFRPVLRCEPINPKKPVTFTRLANGKWIATKPRRPK